MSSACPGSLPPVLVTIGLRDDGLLQAVHARGESTRIIAVEPDPTAARALQQTPTFQRWRRDGRIHLVVGPGYLEATHAWRLFPEGSDTFQLLVHPDLDQHAPESLEAVRVTRQLVFGVRANAEARRALAPVYLRNTLRNLRRLASGRDVSTLRHRFTGVPAVIVAAGPSLDSSLAALAPLTTRALVIAADTAARPLLAAGIEPHLVVALDPSPSNGRHFLALPPMSRTWLVAEGAIDPSAPAAFAERTLWWRVGEHHPWPWLTAQGLAVDRMDVWGSVLTAALQVATLAGCDPLVLVGADLAFTDGRPYCRNTTYELDWSVRAAAGERLQDVWAAQVSRAGVRTTTDLRGRETQTSDALMSFRDWLLRESAQNRPRLLNATGAGILFGAGIEGVDLEALARLPVRADLVGPVVADAASPAGARGVGAIEHALGGEPPGLSGVPTAAWTTFTFGQVTPDEIAGLLAAEGGVVEPLLAADSALVASALDRLPESLQRYASGLTGAAEPGAAAPAEAAGDSLAHAWALLDALMRRAVTEPDPVVVEALADVAPIAVLRRYHWPDVTRWLVAACEGTLGRTMPAAAPVAAVDDRPVKARSVDLQATDARARLGDNAAEAVGRLMHIWTRLACDRRSGDSSLALPDAAAASGWLLRPSMARLAAGALVVGGRVRQYLAPTRVVHAAHSLSVAYAVGDAVVCAETYGPSTVVVSAMGEVRLHRTWPRPIVGVLRLPDGGEVAWDNGRSGAAGCDEPAVMWARGEQMRTQPIEVRPTVGVAWQNRVYWSCFPTPADAWSGLASWAPGEAARREASMPPCLALHVESGRLRLEPAPFTAGLGFTRQPTAHAWSWSPGDRPVDADHASTNGARSAFASRCDWTAESYPEADLVTLTHVDGYVVSLACYYPWQLAWAGDSLVVSTTEREVLVFRDLRLVIDRMRAGSAA